MKLKKKPRSCIHNFGTQKLVQKWGITVKIRDRDAVHSHKTFLFYTKGIKVYIQIFCLFTPSTCTYEVV